MHIRLCRLLIPVLLIITQLHGNDSYRQEFKQFKHSQKFKTIFDRHASPEIRTIQRDIENYQHLSYFQRLIRFVFFALDVIIVTPGTMPQLYAYIDTICKQQSIKTPTIFLTRKKSFFNAAAQKLLTSSGGIVIGQDLLLETSDKELEAVIAHEIGHIKYNHINKTMGINIATLIACAVGSHYLTTDPNARFWLTIAGVKFIPSLIINKSFEQEADQFAYKVTGHGEGLIEFFEHIQTMEHQRDNDIVTTRAMLRNAHISCGDYVGLMMRYYLAKTGHLLNKAYRWIYYNTPYGPHPSPQARISVTKRYLEQQ